MYFIAKKVMAETEKPAFYVYARRLMKNPLLNRKQMVKYIEIIIGR